MQACKLQNQTKLNSSQLAGQNLKKNIGAFLLQNSVDICYNLQLSGM
jgi:hypothetical protein